ncbi:MAG: HDIG domain-containing protein [Desulfobulbaceae bacterium]|nr:HDIG domain-containing protein [Desulfobulbaceae bacterium]
MLANIRDHSIIVARIATRMAEELHCPDRQLSLPLVTAAALLHDIGKTSCLDSDRDHAAYGREICLAHGLAELAPIVGDHVRFRDNPTGDFSEYEVVFYADKRVTHEQVVSLEEREIYILERYGRNDPHRLAIIREHCRSWRLVEARLFSSLWFAPAELAELIDRDPATCDFAAEETFASADGPARLALGF